MVSAPTVRHYSDPAVALPTPPISASVAQALAAAAHLPVTTVTPQPAAIVPIPPLTTDRPTDDRPTGIRLCLTTPSALPLTPSPTPALATPPSTLQWTLALPSTTWDVVKSTTRHCQLYLLPPTSYLPPPSFPSPPFSSLLLDHSPLLPSPLSFSTIPLTPPYNLSAIARMFPCTV